MDEFSAAAEAQVPEKAMEPLNRLLMQAIGLEESISQMEEDLKAAKSALSRLKQGSIPEMMLELGLDAVVFNGWSVTTVDFVYGSLPKEPDKKEAAIRWLESHDGGGLIKTKVGLVFGRTEHNQALSVAEGLREQGLDPQVESGVHAQTLHAFVRERLREGGEIDLETLGCTVGAAVQIKRK